MYGAALEAEIAEIKCILNIDNSKNVKRSINVMTNIITNVFIFIGILSTVLAMVLTVMRIIGV